MAHEGFYWFKGEISAAKDRQRNLASQGRETEATTSYHTERGWSYEHERILVHGYPYPERQLIDHDGVANDGTIDGEKEGIEEYDKAHGLDTMHDTDSEPDCA